MKRYIQLIGAVVLVFSLILAPSSGSTLAQDPKEDAIVAGLAWLAEQQQADGGWLTPGDCDRVAYSGLAALKLASRALEAGLDPLDPANPYSTNVQKALDFIMAQAQTMPIGPQPAGNPDGNGDGIARYWDDGCWGGHRTYNTSIALMALSTSKHPELYGLAAQNALDFLAWGQSDIGCEPHRGGWRYSDNECNSDNSNSGWVTLALGFAQAGPPFGFGLTVPQFVLDELNIWLAVIQDPVDGDPDDGGSWYEPGWSWVNILKTGNLLYEFALEGDTKTSPRVLAAIDYLERHWLDVNNDPGWGYMQDPANYHAMFTTMKGLEALGVELLDLDGDGTPEHDWFAEYVNVLTTQQTDDGSWQSCYWGNPVICTTWALLTLEKFVPIPRIPVAVDIKPMSCPNPVSTKDKGVIPVAILGTAEFDVTKVDPVSVFLGWTEPTIKQVFALKWKMYDAATPYEPYLGKVVDRFSCTKLGADGFMDLVLYFKSQEVLGMLSAYPIGAVLTLPLGGNLKEEFGGTPIMGEDVVWKIK